MPTMSDLRTAPLPTLLRWWRIATDVRARLAGVSRTEEVEWNLARADRTLVALDAELARRSALAAGARERAHAG
jgi:hypothetical protein